MAAAVADHVTDGLRLLFDACRASLSTGGDVAPDAVRAPLPFVRHAVPSHAPDTPDCCRLRHLRCGPQ